MSTLRLRNLNVTPADPVQAWGVGGILGTIGDKHLAVPLDQELKFRKALLKLGYVLPAHATT
jgi:hypothetical protein